MIHLPYNVTADPANAPLLALCRDTYVTSKELGARWRVTVVHLANLRRQRKGPPFLKIGGAIRYRASDIVAFELSGYRGTVSPQELQLAVMNLPGLSKEQRVAISENLIASLYPR